MKRFLSLTLIAIMLLSTLIFTSCNYVNQAKDFVHGIFGIGDDARYTITEEEWNNAFEITNYTAIMMTDEYNVITSLDYPYMKYEMVSLDDSGLSEVMYMDLQTGDIYYEENGKWVKLTGQYMIVDEERTSLKVDLRIDEINFDDLEYDKETKSYNYNQRTEADMVFKFENGVLVSVEMFMKAGLDNTKQIATNFGTTVVELPQVDD